MSHLASERQEQMNAVQRALDEKAALQSTADRYRKLCNDGMDLVERERANLVARFNDVLNEKKQIIDRLRQQDVDHYDDVVAHKPRAKSVSTANSKKTKAAAAVEVVPDDDDDDEADEEPKPKAKRAATKKKPAAPAKRVRRTAEDKPVVDIGRSVEDELPSQRADSSEDDSPLQNAPPVPPSRVSSVKLETPAAASAAVGADMAARRGALSPCALLLTLVTTREAHH